MEELTDMDEILARLSKLIERGKISRDAPYPPDLVGEDGVSEVTQQAIAEGIDPQIILNKGLMVGMHAVGEKFSEGEVFITDMLIAARAMNAAMEHLQQFFLSGEIEPKGTFVLGTVRGDLHDIGKNLVKMIMEGDGWSVVDLGTDVREEQFVEAVNKTEGAIVGMSALLTTTMLHMESVVKSLRANNPATQIYIGGAPVSQAFADQIGADGYFSNPHGLVKALRV